jgi:Short C-terminal domain
MGINSPDGFDTAFRVFPWIFGAMVVFMVCGWIFTAVVLGRNRRVLRQAGVDPTTAGAQLAVRMIRGQPAAPSASSRLSELSDLRDRGLITPQEYEARRTQIIAGI